MQCDNEHEVLRLVALAGNAEITGKKRSARAEDKRRKLANEGAELAHRNGSAANPSLTVLKKIQSAGADGVSGHTIVSLLGLSHNRSVGNAMLAARKAVSNLNVDVDQVFVRRGKPGNRRWIARPAIGEAIKALESHGGAK